MQNKFTQKRHYLRVWDVQIFWYNPNDKNCVHEEVKSRLISGNASCHSFELWFPKK